MKVLISNYRNHWISPYTILEKICFWEKDRDVFYNHEDVPNHKYQKWVDFLDPICEGLRKFLDIVHPRINYVKIDPWDTWSMDHSLAKIVLPALKQLKEDKHGSPYVDLDLVPEELRYTGTEEYDQQYCFDFYHEDKADTYPMIENRWDYVLDEMIFAFEHLLDESWEEEFKSGTLDMIHVPCEWDENGKPTMYQMERGPNDTFECDYDAIFKVHERMQNGFRLFGIYYRNLWT
jgi:hypothetical protein